STAIALFCESDDGTTGASIAAETLSATAGGAGIGGSSTGAEDTEDVCCSSVTLTDICSRPSDQPCDAPMRWNRCRPRNRRRRVSEPRRSVMILMPERSCAIDPRFACDLGEVVDGECLCVIAWR